MKERNKMPFDINDALLEEAIELDSSEKMHRATQKELLKKARLYTKWASLAAVCISLCVGSVLVYRASVVQPDTRIQISSPLKQVESISDMKQYLGFDIPVLAEKEIALCRLYSDGNYAYMGEVVYKDGTEFRIQKGTGNISGVYGGKHLYSEEKSGITVHFYSADSKYATWTQKGFACCYYADEGYSAFSSDIAELILCIKK